VNISGLELGFGMDIESEIKKIKERNARVEMDKAW
jgi:hypothetical protein